MWKTTLVPFIFVLFGVVLAHPSGQSGSPQSRSEDFLTIERAYAHKMQHSLAEANGRSNLKTTRRSGNLPQPTREPSIQAYGLPKRVAEDNGVIERVNLDRVSGLDGKVDEIHHERPGVQAYGLRKKVTMDNGVIERLGQKEPSSWSSEHDDSIRKTRSIDGLARNDLEDLEAQEAKVFRPLFVYRQQVADRYRVKPRKNPIYGSYQYGTNGWRNSIMGYHKRY